MRKYQLNIVVTDAENNRVINLYTDSSDVDIYNSWMRTIERLQNENKENPCCDLFIKKLSENLL